MDYECWILFLQTYKDTREFRKGYKNQFFVFFVLPIAIGIAAFVVKLI